MKLIDALSESQWDYFINCIYDCCNELGATDNISANCLIDCLANMEIEAAQTVDAVPVVRCRECKYHNKPPCPMRLSFNWTEDDDFCSYGERKEGAD